MSFAALFLVLAVFTAGLWRDLRRRRHDQTLARITGLAVYRTRLRGRR